MQSQVRRQEVIQTESFSLDEVRSRETCSAFFGSRHRSPLGPFSPPASKRKWNRIASCFSPFPSTDPEQPPEIKPRVFLRPFDPPPSLTVTRANGPRRGPQAERIIFNERSAIDSHLTPPVGCIDQAGGLEAMSRRSSGATPPDADDRTQRPREGSKKSPGISCIPSGCPVRWEPGPVASLVPRSATG